MLSSVEGGESRWRRERRSSGETTMGHIGNPTEELHHFECHGTPETLSVPNYESSPPPQFSSPKSLVTPSELWQQKYFVGPAADRRLARRSD
ncbi:hypothetical protein KM043_008120 [Ampulex compressa]|nr:hypothetical protein KM043_008120 [Ampulex compressa]